MVTVVVVTYRGLHLLPDCLDSLDRQTVPHQLLVVDNASTDGSAALLRRRLRPDQVLTLATNTGFAGGVAAALPAVHTRYVALLNDDAAADPDWLELLLAAARDDPSAAAWTSLMESASEPGSVNNLGAGVDGRWYGVDVDAGRDVSTLGSEVRDVFGFCGGAALLRTAAVRAVGGFPAGFFLYYEDLDTSWRLRLAGWSIRAVPRSRVVHRHGATSDPTSVLFHLHNERNRLWTLARNAPGRIFLAALLRFGLTTASLAARRVLRRPVPPAANFRVGLRLRVLAQVLRSSPALLPAPGRAPASTRRRIAREARSARS
nr:glycosyltransferase family 2 protein [Nakamurella flavida]